MNHIFLTGRSFLALTIVTLMFLGASQVGYTQQLLEFQESQTIPTNGAEDWEYFTIGTEHYLVVANYPSNQDSKIYRWDGKY